MRWVGLSSLGAYFSYSFSIFTPSLFFLRIILYQLAAQWSQRAGEPSLLSLFFCLTPYCPYCALSCVILFPLSCLVLSNPVLSYLILLLISLTSASFYQSLCALSKNPRTAKNITLPLPTCFLHYQITHLLIFPSTNLSPHFSQAELQASDTNSKAAGGLFLSVVFCSLSFVIGFTLVTIIAPTAWG